MRYPIALVGVLLILHGVTHPAVMVITVIAITAVLLDLLDAWGHA